MLLKNERGRAAARSLARSRRVAVVGEPGGIANLGDHGSSEVAPSFAVTPLDGIRALAGGVAVTYVPGPPLSADDQAAVAAADAAVVVAGLTRRGRGRGRRCTTGDRLTLDLAAGQEELIAAVAALNPRTVVVLEGGSAVTMPWVGDVAGDPDGLVSRAGGGQAIAEVLFGDVNPSGKLPLTFPRAEERPAAVRQPAAPSRTLRLLPRLSLARPRSGIAPLFPFGFGLSYTTFRYANLALSRPAIGPHGTAARDGRRHQHRRRRGRRGRAALRGLPAARSVERAVRDLRDFARVHLEPGETRTVALEVRGRGPRVLGRGRERLAGGADQLSRPRRIVVA